MGVPTIYKQPKAELLPGAACMQESLACVGGAVVKPKQRETRAILFCLEITREELLCHCTNTNA
jgi:hypothetical protein